MCSSRHTPAVRRLSPATCTTAPSILAVLSILAATAPAQRQFSELRKRALPEDHDRSRAVALGDVDGDGDLDAIIGNDGANRLYLNRGDGIFTDETASRLPDEPCVTRAVALGDVDGDGDLDIVLGNVDYSRRSPQNRLYENDGTGTFTDVTATRMPPDADETYVVALGDVDGDGDLDMVIGNAPRRLHPGQDRLYLNDGTGTFSDATATSLPPDVEWTGAVALGDVDSDGDLDLAIGNGRANRLYLVVLDNLDFATESFNAGVPIRRARGLVILSRMYASPHVYAAAGWAEDSERVVFVRFRNHLSAGPGIITRSSNVWLIDSFIKSDYSAGQPLTLYHGGAHFAGGTAWVIGSRVEGGTAHPNGLSGVDWGIESGGSNLFVAGGSTVIGGSWGYATGLCTRNANSLRHWSVYQRSYLPPDPRAVWFVHDPNTTLDNCVESQGHEMTREFPAVLPGEAMRGQPQSIRTFGPTRSIVSVFASFVHGAPPVRLSIGDVWLDPGLVVHVGTGAVDANRRLTMQTTIPSWLAVGDVLVYQAVSLSPRSAWEISQPGFAVVRDP